MSSTVERTARKLNKVEQVRSLLSEGTVLECVENTYIPKLNGTRRKLTRVGKAVAEGVSLDAACEGKLFRMYLPTRVCDVLAVSDDEFTYLLDESVERLCAEGSRVGPWEELPEVSRDAWRRQAREHLEGT
jgi:hypothetical protein